MNKLNYVVSIFGLFIFPSLVLANGSSNIENSKSINEKLYIVKVGDSLYSIAERYSLSIEKLQRWNNLKDANNISIGQKIRLTESNINQVNSPQHKELDPEPNQLEGLTTKPKTNPDKPLIEQAKMAFSQRDYSLSAKLFNRLYKQGNEIERQFALEYLGVSREKNGQLAFAKQAYQLFLKNYPEVESISRVKMRLNNLIGVETLTKDRRFKTTTKKRNTTSYVRGSLSSDYRHAVLEDNLGNSRDTLSLANIDVNARGNFEQDGYNVGFRVSVGHYEDLLPDSDKTNEQIRYLNLSASSDDDLYKVTIGRQRSRGKGIFGRFDGVVLSNEILTDIQVNLVAGYPVASSKVTELDPERQFYGVSVDVEDSWQDIDFSLFVFEQSINDLVDRRAVGGELSYFKNAISAYSLIDYDIFFNELNALLFSGNYTTQSKQRYSWSLNYRKSPYVGTRNALIGQSVDSFAELQDLFISDEEILDLALDRTLTSKMASLQFFQPINDDYDISTSLTWMNLSSAPESGGVPAISESGDQLYANIYLSARQLYSENDHNSIGFRYSNLASSSVYSLYATSRYRFDNGLSITPKLRFDDRSNDNGTSQQSVSPTFRLQYQTKKHFLYVDLGGIFYNAKSTLVTSQKTSIYFMYLGYRYYFDN